MFAAIRQWVIKTMMKGNTGVVQTMPKQQIIEMNVQITAERIMRNGINPEDLKSVGQVENVVKQIEQPKVNVNPGMTSVKKADVFDIDGNKLDPEKGILAGRQREPITKSDEALKAEMDASNQKGIAGIKNNRQMNADELEDFENEIGGNLEAYDFDGTVGSARNILKEQKKYEADMFAEYKSIGGSKRPGGPKASERDSMPIRLMKNFEKELNEVDLMAEGFSKDQANVLIKARKKMTSGDEMNPNESLTRVKEEFADNAGVDVDDFTDIDFEIDVPEYADGGRIGLKSGLGKAFIEFLKNTGKTMNDKNPIDLGKDYLKYIKDESIKGNSKAVAPGVLTVGAGGILANRVVGRKLEEMNKEQKMQMYQDTKKEFIEQYKNDPQLLEIMLKNLDDRTFGKVEEKADGGRIGLKDGTFEDYMKERERFEKERGLEQLYKEYQEDLRRQEVGEQKQMAADGGRIGLKAGMTKRAFLKLMGAGVAGVGAVKSGLFSLGKGAGKTVAKEVAQQTTSGMPPPHFFKLVEKIKILGKDATPKYGTQPGEKVTAYKDYTLSEEINSGRTTIQRSKQSEIDYYDEMLMEDVYMSHTPGKSQMDETTKGKIPLDEYVEDTSYMRTSGPQKGDIVDTVDGVPDDLLEEVGEAAVKKADGGRIGLFMGGGLTAGKGLAKEMLKFMSKGSVNAKSPTELLQLYNSKQFNKLLNNPANTGKISPATGETADEMILDMIKKTKEDRSSMVGDLIGSARKIKKVDDDIAAYKKKIIKDMMDGGIDENEARGFADLMAKEMKENAAPQLTSSPPKVTEQGLLELENIQKNLLTRGRQLQASGGLATMLGE